MRSGAVTLILLSLLCALSWSLTVPPFESPDETGHARYVSFLMRQRRLPVPGDESPGEAHQPPLYYALAAATASAAGLPPIAVAPGRNPRFRWYGGTEENKYLHPASERPPLSGSAASLHWLRLISVALGTATALVVGLMAARAGVSRETALVAAGFAAFLPQFTFISASLNNDALANLLSAGCFAALVSAMRFPAAWGAWAAAGLLAGLALVTKFTVLALVPCGLLAAALARGGGRLRSSTTATRAAAFLVPALLVPMPLLLRNMLVLGDPLGSAAVRGTLPQLIDRKTVLSGYFLTEFPVVLFRSFWGMFGWMSFSMPEILYAAALAATAAAGLGLALLRRDGFTRKVHMLCAAAIALQIGQVVVYNLTFTQAQGRFLFPVLGPIALLLCAGLGEIGRRIGLPSPGPRGAALLVALMAAANLCLLRFMVAPAYLAAARVP